MSDKSPTAVAKGVYGRAIQTGAPPEVIAEARRNLEIVTAATECRRVLARNAPLLPRHEREDLVAILRNTASDQEAA